MTGCSNFCVFMLKLRKQGAKINDTENVSQLILLVIPHHNKKMKSLTL